MNCPHCNSTNVASVAGMMRCQDCEQYFQAAAATAAPAAPLPNLMQCPACLQPVSPQAADCPKCGQPLRSAANRSMALKIVMVSLFLIVVFLALFVTIRQMDREKDDAAAISKKMEQVDKQVPR